MNIQFSKSFFVLFLSILISPVLQTAGTEQFHSYQKGNYLFFTGEGKANPDATSKTQRQSLAQEAAILVGKSKIAAYIHNLQTKKGEKIEEVVKKDGKIRSHVESFLAGVENVESKWDDNDNCTVTLKINKKTILKKLKARE